MLIKSFEEAKKIINEHPKASGVGYVVTPQLLKIASKLGLVGYSEGLKRWLDAPVSNEIVFPKYPPDETDEDGEPYQLKFCVQWEGNGIRMYSDDMMVIGLQRLIEDIELAIKEPEEKKEELKMEDGTLIAESKILN